MTTDNFCCYLQNRLIKTSQTGGQWYSDTSPFSIPWLFYWKKTRFKNFENEYFKKTMKLLKKGIFYGKLNLKFSFFLFEKSIIKLTTVDHIRGSKRKNNFLHPSSISQLEKNQVQNF
jgi:hypothetical protein